MSSRKSLLDSYVHFIQRVGGVRTNMRRVFRPLYRRSEVSTAERRIPGFEAVASRIAESRRELQATYETYTNSVSSDVHALAIEVCALLDAYCRVRAPKKVLDLGSGFSSFVLRSYQKRSGGSVSVKTVDDSEEWLARTRGFLTEHDLPTDSMIHANALSSEDVGQFDLVCYDLGNFETRTRMLPVALDCARPRTGVVLIDDCHRVQYLQVVQEELRRREVAPIPLVELTRDGFGRYCCLATGFVGHS